MPYNQSQCSVLMGGSANFFYNRIIYFIYRLAVNPQLRLTSQVFVQTKTWISPRIIATICDTPVFSDPNKTIWAIIKFRSFMNAFPIPITICDISNNLRFCLAWILLFYHFLGNCSCKQKNLLCFSFSTQSTLCG